MQTSGPRGRRPFRDLPVRLRRRGFDRAQVPGGGRVAVFSINSATGVLTPISGSPFAAAASPVSLAVNSAGTFAYGADGWGSVSGFSIDATSGALTDVPGSPFGVWARPVGIGVVQH
jgi:hypothetical protein